MPLFGKRRDTDTIYDNSCYPHSVTMATFQPTAQGDYHSPVSPSYSEIYHNLILYLRDRLTEQGVISRVEYVGSAYKGTMMASSDMDNLFIKYDETITVEKYPNKPEYVFLSRDGRKLHPRRTLDMFKGKIDQVLNGLGLTKPWHTLVLADHGPAIELRYFSGPAIELWYFPDGMRRGAQPTFSVDLVFCYEVNAGQAGRRMFTAKPYTPSGIEQLFPPTNTQKLLWKQSTALEEKQMMSTIDKNHTCCRWAIRIMKAIKDKETTLQVLTSYVFEQVLFSVYGQKPIQFWREANIKECVRLLLQQTANGVDAGLVKNHFNPVENVLRWMDIRTKINVVNRLRKLAEDPVLDSVMANLGL